MSALCIDSMGLSQKGMALIDAKNGKFDYGSTHPLWLSGGNKARGNTFGASGIYQVAEACANINNYKSSDSNKTIALLQCLGSFGAQAVTTIVGQL